jgi:hypothetical protein
MKKQKKTLSEIIWDKTGLSFWSDWFQIPFKGFNWISFHFIHLYIEWDKYGNEFVFEIALLGFGMRWQLSLEKWIKTEQNEELKKRMAKLTKKLNKKC